MAKLDDDELRELISQNIPDAVFDDMMTRVATVPPPSAHVVVDRAELARKIAAQRLGIDSHAVVPELDDLQTPSPLIADKSAFIGRPMRSADGITSVKTTVVSTETGEAIAEQG